MTFTELSAILCIHLLSHGQSFLNKYLHTNSKIHVTRNKYFSIKTMYKIYTLYKSSNSNAITYNIFVSVVLCIFNNKSWTILLIFHKNTLWVAIRNSFFKTVQMNTHKIDFYGKFATYVLKLPLNITNFHIICSFVVSVSCVCSYFLKTYCSQ